MAISLYAIAALNAGIALLLGRVIMDHYEYTVKVLFLVLGIILAITTPPGLALALYFHSLSVASGMFLYLASTICFIWWMRKPVADKANCLN